MALDNEVWGAASVYGVQHVIRPQETREISFRTPEVHQIWTSNGIGQHLLRAWPTSS